MKKELKEFGEEIWAFALFVCAFAIIALTKENKKKSYVPFDPSKWDEIDEFDDYGW